MNLGINVKTAREKHQINQKQLAAFVGITPAMVNQIEKGTKIPSLAVSLELAKALNTTVDELCKGA